MVCLRMKESLIFKCFKNGLMSYVCLLCWLMNWGGIFIFWFKMVDWVILNRLMMMICGIDLWKWLIDLRIDVEVWLMINLVRVWWCLVNCVWCCYVCLLVIWDNGNCCGNDLRKILVLRLMKRVKEIFWKLFFVSGKMSW